ncbi:tetratricopeptide repeat protein [Mariprofundus micogutta]|uniref:Tetratricopeptide repeat protein n=1 Tax=Mariprofundus micogutta TaxID=1921010 RepID=A0A1L8CP72_9PROT|nr:tetratricopeptide repeat protein [Mariprofundus micogutta]GAV20720.1 tetratricopeptide repeat protein [Mariprofundus micogutta]
MKKQYITICAALCCLGFSTHANANAMDTELLFSTSLKSAGDALLELTTPKVNTSASWDVASNAPVMLTMTETAPPVIREKSAAQGDKTSAPVSGSNKPVATIVETPTPAAEKKAAEPMAPAVPALSSEELFTAAKTALMQGNRSKALDHLAQLLSVNPGHRAARLMYGKELVLNHQYAEASLVLPELLNSSSDWRAWYWMGTASLMRGQLNDAENYLSEAIARNGEVAELWVQRAIIAQENNNHETALQLLSIAKDLDPDMPEVSLNIGYSADALGNKKLANRAYGHFLVQTNRSPKHIRVRQKVISLF